LIKFKEKKLVDDQGRKPNTAEGAKKFSWAKDLASFFFSFDDN